MRIVLDPNVVISALLWRGLPYQLLTALRAHPASQLYSSPVLLVELTDVLTRPAATRQLAAIGNTPRAVLADYLEVIELVEPVDSPRVARDPDDDQVLAAALSARADVIVSGDADLLTLGSFQNIRILAPRAALGMLAGHSG